MRRSTQQQDKIGYGRPRGWRPRAEETVAARPVAELNDEPEPNQADYGIHIIWGSSKRRPGARLEKMAAKQH
jgi:hypothetical protein